MHNLLFLLLAFFLYPKVDAPTSFTYYVKIGGDDQQTGTSAAQAWGSLDKVSRTNFSAGDRILFNKGDSWNDTLIATSSGDEGNPIIYGSYGTGANPKISGFSTITSGWTSLGGNIYRATVPNGGQMIQVVTVDGTPRAKGRFPLQTPGYGGYWAADQTLNGNINSASLTGRNYGGGKAEVVIRRAHDIISRATITGHAPGSNWINFVEPSDPWNLGNGFFVQNHASTLSAHTNWMYDTGSGYLDIYLNTAPTNYEIKVSNQAGVLFSLKGKHDVTLDGIDFEGSNGHGIVMDGDYGNGGLAVINCNVKLCAGSAIRPLNLFDDADNRGFLINANTVADCNGGIVSFYNCNKATVTNNIITRIGLLPGNGIMEESGYGISFSLSNHTSISNNRLTFIGYIGINLFGGDMHVFQNFISDFDLVKDDGGGIYVQRRHEADYNTYARSTIEKNIIINGIGNPFGITNGESWSDGLYSDDRVNEIDWLNNYVSSCSRNGIYMHTTFNTTIRGNLSYNSNQQMAFEPNAAEYPTQYLTGFNVKKNTLVLGSPSQWFLLLRSDNGADRRGELGAVDSNSYYGPNPGAARFWTSYKLFQNNQWVLYEQFLTLASFQTIGGAGYETTPVNTSFVKDADTRFEYNETPTPKTVILPAKYANLTGTQFTTGSMELQPYTAEVIFKRGALDVVSPSLNGIEKTRRKRAVKVISIP